jgi:hypothetical protein
MRSTAATHKETQSISMVYRRRTFSAQSGALEKIRLREAKFGLAAIPELLATKALYCRGLSLLEFWRERFVGGLNGGGKGAGRQLPLLASH